MKKNLRIVSVAAAALLAVAPVAASAVSVNAAATTVVKAPANSSTVALDEVTADYTSTKLPSEDAVLQDLKDANVLPNGVKFVKNSFKNTKTVVNGNKATYSLTFQLQTDGKNTDSAAKIFKAAGYKLSNDNKNGYINAANGGVQTFSVEYTVVQKAQAGTPATGTVSNNTISFSNSDASSKGDVNFASALQAVTFPQETTTNNVTGATRENLWDGQINGTVNASYKGQSYPVTFEQNGKVTLFEKKGSNFVPVNKESDGRIALEPAKAYYVLISGASVNLGVTNANLKNITLGSENGDVKFLTNHHPDTAKATLNANTNQNGGVYTQEGNLGKQFGLLVKVVPTDVTNHTVVSFFDRATNSVVNSGSLTMNATNYKLNVKDVLAQAKTKYTAAQETYNGNARNNGNYTRGGATVTTTEADLTAQLEKAGIKVDGVGNFEAPASFSFNLNAKSDANGATATLPVSVTVNGAKQVAAQETTKTVTIMHISTIYDKNGKATHEPALRAYDTYSVVSTPVNLKDEKGKDAGMFYKLAGKDQYIKVGNVDGTSRSLKHNSYVYKSTGKRNGKKVLKKGSSVTTYGKSFMIAGHQMYRIGRNQYVKKANF